MVFNNHRFVHVSSAGVTRPDRPGLDLSKQPPAVRLNKELDFILTYKLKVLFHSLVVFFVFFEMQFLVALNSSIQHPYICNSLFFWVFSCLIYTLSDNRGNRYPVTSIYIGCRFTCKFNFCIIHLAVKLAFRAFQISCRGRI